MFYGIAWPFHIANIVALTKFLHDRDNIVLANKREKHTRVSEVEAIEILQKAYIPN